jgi:hypothetical protein
MIPQYSHNLMTSAYLWLDNQICGTGQAYVNVTGSLYLNPVTGGRNNIYASPYKGWVYDSCVGGATIPTGFYNSSGQFLTRASGLVIDFNNGQVSTPQNWGPTLSGVYARKEINLYYSSNEEISYVLEQVYGANKNVSYTFTGFQGKSLAAPLIMLTNTRGENKPWALGGTDDSKNTIGAFIITNSNYLQDGVNSLLQDTAHSTIPYVPASAAPITASGDLKTVGWSYCTDISDAYTCLNGLYVQNVYMHKVSDKVNRSTTFFLAACDLDLSKPRMPNS